MNRVTHQGTKWKRPTTVKTINPNIQKGILNIPIITFFIMNRSMLFPKDTYQYYR
jgi:hypothetical protein